MPAPALPSPLSDKTARVLTLCAGVLAALCYSPVNAWPLALPALALLWITLANVSPRQAAWRGLCFGLGYFGVGTSWVYVSISVYGEAGLLLSGLITALFVLVLALFIAAQCWLFVRYGKRRLPAAGFAATWVLFEWLRGWLFTGFPWLYLGSAHVTTPLSGLAPVFGVLGLSFVIALLGALLGRLALLLTGAAHHRQALVASLAAMALLTGAGVASNLVSWVEPSGETLSVGIVQGNIAQSVKFDPDELQNSLSTYDRLSQPLWGENDFLLWPETAIPLVYQNAGDILDWFGEQSAAADSALVTGIFYRLDSNIHNSITVLGNGSGEWHKQKLVPFGEYVPLRELVGRVLQIFALPMSSLSPGPSEQDLLTINGYRAAAFICYEVVYPGFVRRYGADADFLLTISNDTWFGASFGPRQHLQIAAMRAREMGRSMVRGTNNGVSALINARGEIIARTPQFEEATLTGDIDIMRGTTPFARWGSIPVLLLSSLIFLLNFPAMRQQRTPAQD